MASESAERERTSETACAFPSYGTCCGSGIFDRRNIAAGPAKMVRGEVVDCLLEGENAIRVCRKHRGLSAQALAQEVKISGAYLSEIELGRKEGGISVLKRVAEALSVDLDDLV